MPTDTSFSLPQFMANALREMKHKKTKRYYIVSATETFIQQNNIRGTWKRIVINDFVTLDSQKQYPNKCNNHLNKASKNWDTPIISLNLVLK